MIDISKELHKWLITHDDGEITLKEDAPNWAVKEFELFNERIEQSGKPNEDGIIIDY